MSRLYLLWTRIASATAVLILISVARGDDSVGSAKVLTDKGLTKVGSNFILNVDAHLADRLKEIRQAQAQLDTYGRQHEAIQADIDRANHTLSGLTTQIQDVDKRQEAVGKDAFGSYNALVNQHNTLVNQIRDGEAYLRRRNADLEKLNAPQPPTDKIIALANDMDAADAEYTKLRGDADVARAIDAVGSTGPKVHLGPSIPFTQQLPILRHQRDALMKNGIKGHVVHGTLQVTTTLNGGSSVPMVVDSGAATVLLTASVAKQANVEFKGKQTITLVTANGAQVVAQVGTIKSLAVGAFIANDIECAVLPAGTAGDDCLLGETFLQHFLYQIDFGGAELRLSPLGKDVSMDKKAAALAPTSNPASPAPASQPTDRVRRLTIAATIDGKDDLKITGSGLTWLHKANRFAAAIKVNGHDWDAKSEHTLAADGDLSWLSGVELSHARIDNQSGREPILLDSAADAVTVHFSDDAHGAAEYSVTLRFD